MSSIEMYRVNKDKVSELHRMYKDGMTLTEIGNITGHTRHTIKKWFVAFGFEYTPPKRKTTAKYNEEIIYEMYKLYVSGLSTLKIGEKFKVSPSTVSRLFTRMGLEMRSNSLNSRKYKVNHDYFEEIDTEEKAYWLGFIYADGYLTTRDGRQMFGVSIASKDRNLLELLNKSLHSDYKIREYKVTGGYKVGVRYSRLIISSEKICNDLQKHGVFKQKTNILLPPKIKREFIRHFIRGYIDGDGSIFKTDNDYGYDWHLSIVGTNELLTYVIEYFFEEGLVQRKTKLEKRKKHHKISYIRYGGNIQLKKILDHIYCDAKLFLERKYNVFKELVEYFERG
ncbi:hypothetical protein LG298_09795 [Cytobacillus firmus]|uniref:LAGLIDADG family homing endonuclease n=1 Tax=Cytobacillus firmus TaxID=1399 RepID=UPI00384F3A64